MFSTVELPGSIPIHLLYEDEVEAWRSAQSDGARNWLKVVGFKGERHKLALLPTATGGLQAVAVGLGRRMGTDDLSLWHGAALPDRLPDGAFHLATRLGRRSASQFALGWAYGQYHFARYKHVTPGVAASVAPRELRLRLPAEVDLAEIERLRAATTLSRDLINTPANDMTPAALGDAIAEVAKRFNATCRKYVGDELLAHRFPAVHAVGRGSSVAPRLIDFEWGNPDHPRVTLVGKGVCFDTGGLDIKPSPSMLLMKKDMGGAAVVLGLAQAIMDAALPVRLRVIIPAVENSISAEAYRPSDVLATRKGLSVEVNNTDAEGRLILCDALTLADADQPELLIDMATLTGAARVALGPEIPGLFSNDEKLASDLVQTAHGESDPMWLLPLWAGYDDELSSKVADMSNISSSGQAGAIIAGLFLKRFVTATRSWLHLDLYAWNSKDRPGRPVGGEPQCLRAVYAFLKARYAR
jgi:leucyl aminopeptidase